MNGLRANAKPLLRIVGNKPHATDSDHEDSRSRQKVEARASGEVSAEVRSDLNSSSDIEDNLKDYKPRPPRIPVRAPKKITGKFSSTNIHGSGSIGPSAPGHNKNVSIQPRGNVKSNGVSTNSEEPIEDEAERTVFSQSQGSQKRQRAGYGKQSTYKKAKTIGFRRPQGQIDRSEDQDVRVKHLTLAKPAGTGDTEQADPPSSAGPVFRLPVGGDTASTVASAISKTGTSPRRSRSRSSSLSSLSTPEPEEVIVMKVTKNNLHTSTSPCPICGEQVDLSFKHDFQAERCSGRRMNFRLQELFCKSHKERAAKQTWQDREYPEIDWDGLHKRLTKHNQRIRDVLCSNAKSSYREELKERLQSGKSKTAMQTLENGVQNGSQVGYYGAKGGEIMTNHILKVFGSELRQRAGSDKIISAMGVSGGVSGYLQSVLVPEMALALVMEDTECGVDEARRIILESSEIGDALNEVEEKKVPLMKLPLGGDMTGEEAHYI